jgi:hypothetical protein
MFPRSSGRPPCVGPWDTMLPMAILLRFGALLLAFHGVAVEPASVGGIGGISKRRGWSSPLSWTAHCKKDSTVKNTGRMFRRRSSTASVASRSLSSGLYPTQSQVRWQANQRCFSCHESRRSGMRERRELYGHHRVMIASHRQASGYTATGASTVPLRPARWAIRVVLNVCIDHSICFTAGYFWGATYTLFVAPLTITAMQMGEMVRVQRTAVRWGKTLGSIAATFAGFQTTSFAVFDGYSERWPSIVGSMAIGAFHSRAGQYLFVKSAYLRRPNIEFDSLQKGRKEYFEVHSCMED